jgi:hypothetical protein
MRQTLSRIVSKHICSKSAVIVKGNPKYIKDPKIKPMAERYYAEISDILRSQGYEVSFDPGLPYTQPVDADLWVGHSRGADRLRFAPEGTRTVSLGQDTKGTDPKHYELSEDERKTLQNYS